MRALQLLFRSHDATTEVTDARGRARSIPTVVVPLLVSIAALIPASLLAGCGKATVQTGQSRPGFALAALQSGTSAVIVDAGVSLTDLTPSYRNALTERFGADDSLSSYLAARLIDSLNIGTPRVAVVAAPGLNPRHIIHVRELIVARSTREVPTALLPTGGQQGMQAAGGGTSEAWTVSFEVDVWRPTGALSDAGDGYVATGQEDDGTEPGSAIPPDSATGVKEYSFSVTGRADVPLYAYKTALVEAVNAAAAQAARHLRGQ